MDQSNEQMILKPVLKQTGHNREEIPIVGIGASAGGLAAFESFFSAFSAELNMGAAFVLIQHLDPDHKSMLSELIRRYTNIEVLEVVDGIKVKANCIYVIPSGHDMALFNGTLQLLEPSVPRGQRLSIDFFFKSLAQELRERAICIILSGNGSDGSQGVRAIKGEGGMCMVQAPETTEYDGMPNSAILTGLVDYVLPPSEMPNQLKNYIGLAFEKPSTFVESVLETQDHLLQKVFMLLRTQTGNDFSQYKPNTIYRRIERRMSVNQTHTMAAYVKLLQQSSSEVKALFNDLLIGVTSFFRDSEAYKGLEEIIPQLFADKAGGAAIRIWSVGCSTGEEAYSLAILLREYTETLRHHYNIQVFATDLDGRAIATARAGLYPAGIASDISPERLKKFFTEESDGHSFRINKNIRDMLIFSEQNVIKDPPFSKIDLISCRNLMIYMDSELQKKLIPLFHYALNPKGILFLGSSETIGEFHSEFSVLDRKAKIYQSKEDIHGEVRMALSRLIPPVAVENKIQLPPVGKINIPLKTPLKELTEHTLLQQISPVAVLVNAQGDILYLHGQTGKYLEPSPGEVSTINILSMAREGLKRELTVALHKAVVQNNVVISNGLQIVSHGHYTAVNLTIRPIDKELSLTEVALYLVILDDVTETNQKQTLIMTDSSDLENWGSDLSHDERISALKVELKAKEDYLLATNEELETSNEELMSSNEELQSVNEELQSTNEELETSKEELQSVNEELATVNTELQNKVIDLSRANNDMNNLLAGTGIATLFVDYELRIMRFTPAATRIINLIISDIGRPIGHIVSNLVGYNQLVGDIKIVLDTLIPKEIEVQSCEGLWYMLRIQPYRTLERVIEGVVISFVDITEIVQTREILKEAERLRGLAVAVRDARDAIVVQDFGGKILAWNIAAENLYGWGVDEALGMNVNACIPKEIREHELATLHRLTTSENVEPYLTERISKVGVTIKVWITATVLVNADGHSYGISTTERLVEPAK